MGRKAWNSVSEDAKHVIRQMLKREHHRITAEEALAGEWFADKRSETTSRPCEDDNLHLIPKRPSLKAGLSAEDMEFVQSLPVGSMAQVAVAQTLMLKNMVRLGEELVA